MGRRIDVIPHLATARRLAEALERRHAERPFDIVQSSNYRLTGAFVRRAPPRRHVVRISTSRVLFDDAAGSRGRIASRLTERLDVAGLRRADVVYAPSRLLATYFSDTYGLRVGVVRPPSQLAVRPSRRAPPGVPDRYLLHFGSLGPRKGTPLVAEALSLAWREEPTMRMVWAGPYDAAALARYRTLWGEHADAVVIMGTLDASVIYRLVADAIATVSPSTVDNLPNTVIESLVLGTGVIGTSGASIDELVEPGRSGILVPAGDRRALADAMVAAWRGAAPWLPEGFTTPAALAEMQSDEAVRRFLAHVGRTDRSTS